MELQIKNAEKILYSKDSKSIDVIIEIASNNSKIEKKIRELWLCYTAFIEEIPYNKFKGEHIVQLNGENLKIAKKDFRVLPSAIKFLGRKKVSKLMVKHCFELEYLPDEIEEIDITWLSFTNSSLKDLPITLKNIKNLQIISIIRSRMENIPEVITEVEGLHTLIIEESHITNLSEKLLCSNTLYDINLRKNRITQLPKNLPITGNPKIVRLEGNPLKGGEAERLQRELPDFLIFHDKNPVSPEKFFDWRKKYVEMKKSQSLDNHM